jgi:DNA-binding NarL/FixJ family response regulator
MILIADDSIYSLQGLCELLAGHEIIKCSNGDELIDAHFNYKPDTIITDIKMPVSGITAITEIRKKDKKCFIIGLTSFQEKILLKDTLRSGANMALIKDDEKTFDLIKWAVEKREAIMQKKVQELLVSDDPLLQGLSQRETEIFSLINDGLTVKEIAIKLFLSLLTVRKHKQNMSAKGVEFVERAIYKRGKQ